MIITKLMGGLGNQMFQYAVGRAVAHKAIMPLKLDITYFETTKFRSYRLGCFNIKEDFASIKEIEWFKPRRRQIIAFANYKIREKLLPWHKQRLIRQRGFSYNPDITMIKGSVYLDGYWQSEKYFEDISDIIHREFTIKHKPNNINSQMLTKIDSVNSVSLHIRRGDYITNSKTNQTHGVLSLDYYRIAIDSIVKKVKDPYVFVFSDDIEWVKENLNTTLPLNFIDYNKGEQDFEDLRLISRCKHHIIANSSFSWWGAWLSNYADKIIIAPSMWLNLKKYNTKDIIPNNWIKI